MLLNLSVLLLYQSSVSVISAFGSFILALSCIIISFSWDHFFDDYTAIQILIMSSTISGIFLSPIELVGLSVDSVGQYICLNLSSLFALLIYSWWWHRWSLCMHLFTILHATLRWKFVTCPCKPRVLVIIDLILYFCFAAVLYFIDDAVSILYSIVGEQSTKQQQWIEFEEVWNLNESLVIDIPEDQHLRERKGRRRWKKKQKWRNKWKKKEKGKIWIFNVSH